ncbi:LytTR family DNA-binding domain-containing protein [Sphingomonas sp. BIUV-7]|uniref:LytTR family DNA-binding domain-containing protein n=1 Tax=Sphingomonas natans TaxID=3063330 RepID=A0ABT8Y6C9_9SPHN|nr:LytTR family DNA-binding domain-containing protein [Sphingomonas sp. BIUV-7]MDO6413873.1 LytTR family DNA-binding domain-containing protein [Sphingomonas sp. BIUV-7]
MSEMASVRDISAELLVMAGLGLVLGLLGPFGTFAMPVAARVGMWLVMAIGGYACFRPVIGAGRSLAEQAHLPLALAIALACIVAAVPVTLMVAVLFGQGLEPAALTESYPYVLLVGGLATAIQFLLFARTPAPASYAPPISLAAPTEPAPLPAAPPAFLDRLPPHLCRDLLCLEMEDHYVRAHTTLGSTLILMRMRDAVTEVGGVEGERVHRSWWVARTAVAATLRRERATLLTLSNGLEVPVARDSVALLRSRGWL